MESGALYIVGTPIGNLGDITFRAVDVLSQVDLIAAEDTRKSKILMQRYSVNTPLTSFHSYNQVKKTPVLIEKLKDGDEIAVISEAGTPGISDPAYYLVTRAIQQDIRIISIPGPAAFLTALVVSGLPTNRFVYEGFLPVKKGRKTRLHNLSEEERTIILYESPHRLLRTLNDLLEYFGDRQIVVGRELTKKFEEVVRGKIREVLAVFEKRIIKGEFVLILKGNT